MEFLSPSPARGRPAPRADHVTPDSDARLAYEALLQRHEALPVPYPIWTTAWRGLDWRTRLVIVSALVVEFGSIPLGMLIVARLGLLRSVGATLLIVPGLMVASAATVVTIAVLHNRAIRTRRARAAAEIEAFLGRMNYREPRMPNPVKQEGETLSSGRDVFTGRRAPGRTYTYWTGAVPHFDHQTGVLTLRPGAIPDVSAYLSRRDEFNAASERIDTYRTRLAHERSETLIATPAGKSRTRPS